MKKASLILLAFVLLTSVAYSQNLSPKELVAIKNSKDVSSITSLLTDKGYSTIGVKDEVGENMFLSGWDFILKDSGSLYAVRRFENKAGKVEVRFMISNLYQYKQLLDNLAQEKYMLKGATVFNGKTYAIFTRKNTSFMVAEQQDAMNVSYYEIIVQDSATPTTEMLTYSK